MDKVKEDGVTEIFQFPRNPDTNDLVTGLDKSIDNPFYGASPEVLKTEYVLSDAWDKILAVIVEAEKIKKQIYYEIIDSREPNFYTNKTTFKITEPLSYQKGKDKNFLETFQVILYPRPNNFNSSTSRGRLAIEMMHVLNKIAKSEASVNPHIHNWYISEEKEALLESKKRRDIYQKAMSLMYNLKSASNNFVLYQIGSILKYNTNEPVIRGEISPIALEEKLDNYLSDNGSSQLTYLNSFISLAEDSKTPEGAINNLVKYAIQQAINTGVITHRDGFYVWHSQKSQPSIYQFTSDYKKYIAFFVKEYNDYNPTAENLTNWWMELKNELVNKGIRFE
jgi:hypothetical protein